MGRRKLTDEEKNARKLSQIEEHAEIDKESQLTVFTQPKKSLLSEETIKKFEKEMLPVGTLSELSGKSIYGFSGSKNYDDALSQCLEWRNQYNLRKDATNKIELVNYFPQEHSGKSILVSYNIVENKVSSKEIK